MPMLSDQEIQHALTELPGWSRAGDTLTRTFRCATFPAAMAFVQQVADIAEAQQHHPDIDVRYTAITFHLSTHDAGGITNKDVTLARAIDGAFAA
jgi:4a-hydroxytetrahydrobiopterin dehydratase